MHDWSQDRVVIVASGPNAGQIDLGLAKGKARFIAINNSWKLCPWADVLYGYDFAWWRENDCASGFSGVKLCGERRGYDELGLGHVKVSVGINQILLGDSVGSGANSGFQALNLAVQWGAKDIVLVGFDMQLSPEIHWHGPHEGALSNPKEFTVTVWRKYLDAVYSQLKELGVNVVSGTPTALQNYPCEPWETLWN